MYRHGGVCSNSPSRVWKMRQELQRLTIASTTTTTSMLINRICTTTTIPNRCSTSTTGNAVAFAVRNIGTTSSTSRRRRYFAPVVVRSYSTTVVNSFTRRDINFQYQIRNDSYCYNINNSNVVRSFVYTRSRNRNRNRNRNYSTDTLIDNNTSFWNVPYASMMGLWKHLTDESVRESFQSYVRHNVIKQSILTQNMYGRMHMFALLYGLHNPLFSKYEFSPIDFIQNIGPALQIYHELLIQIMTQEVSTTANNKDSGESMDSVNQSNSNTDISSNHIENLMQQSYSKNIDDVDKQKNGLMKWYKDAINTSTSTATATKPSNIGQLYRIVTDSNFREQYQNAQTIKLLAMMGYPAALNYVPNSCSVEYISLLNAKIVEVNVTDSIYDDDNYDEEDGSSNNDQKKEPYVLARIKVLYNLKRQFYVKSNTNDKDDDDDNDNNKIATSSTPTTTAETYQSIHSQTETTIATTTGVDNASSSSTTTTTTAATEHLKDDYNNASITANLNSTNNNNNRDMKNRETYTETRLGVATIEGWFRGGPPPSDHVTMILNTPEESLIDQPQGLRWKIASATEAIQFFGIETE